MPDDEKLDIPEVPSLTGHDESTDDLETQIQEQLANSELESDTQEVAADPRDVDQQEAPAAPPPATEEQPEEQPGESDEEKPLFAEGATDEQKIQAILEQSGADAANIAKRYLDAQRKITDQGTENRELREFIASEFEKRLPSDQQQQGERTPEQQAEISDEDLSDLFITDSQKALEIVRNEAREAAKEAYGQVNQETLMSQAEEHANKQINNRAKTHLLRTAEQLQDKDGVQRYKDPQYVPTDAELASVMSVLQPEIQFAAKFRDPKTFKVPDEAFEWAELVLNKDSIVKNAEQKGTNRVLEQIEQGAPGAIISNAKGTAKSTAVKDGSNIKSRDQARQFGRGLTTAELKQAIRESEPEF